MISPVPDAYATIYPPYDSSSDQAELAELVEMRDLHQELADRLKGSLKYHAQRRANALRWALERLSAGAPEARGAAE